MVGWFVLKFELHDIQPFIYGIFISKYALFCYCTVTKSSRNKVRLRIWRRRLGTHRWRHVVELGRMSRLKKGVLVYSCITKSNTWWLSHGPWSWYGRVVEFSFKRQK